MNDPSLPDNVQDDQGQPYDAQPYYEYAQPFREDERSIPPQPASAARPVSPPSYGAASETQQQSPWQPAASSPHWAAQGATPPPMHTPTPGSTNSGKRGWWVFGIVSAVCALLIVLAGSFAFYAILTRASASRAGIPTTSGSATSATFHTANCPFTPGDGITVGKELTCGTLTVPEDPAQAHSRSIHLSVAIFKPSATVPADPMVYLSGGPGGALLSDWAPYITATALPDMTQGHTLIMFDQRGTGYSQPALNCSEIEELNTDTQDKILSREEGNALYIAAAQKCHDRLLSNGINLQAYTSINDATDVHDLIDALGYKQADLYGVSYGTRLALTVMRLFPHDIRSVILDSTLPTQINLFNALPAVEQHAYDTLFKGCSASAKCHAEYPQVESVFYQLVTNLNAKPISFQDAKYGAVAINGDNFASWIFTMLYVTQFIPVIPKAITQVSQGNYDLLSRLYGILMLQNDISDGMYDSVECGEDMAFTTVDNLSRATAGMRKEIQPSMLSGLQAEYSLCQLWNENPVPAEQKQAVTSSIPTLILSGEYDPITPASNAELALQTLSQGYLFHFPATGHGVFTTNPCPDSIVGTFLQQPTTRPDDGCIGGMSAPNFA